jgi:ferredoxin
MGMLRDIEFDDVVMVHCAPRPQDVIFRNELHDLVADKKLRLIEVHTDTDGMLDIARLDELVPDWAERETWACGPAGLLDAAEEHWSGHGVPERLHTERFRPSIVVAGAGGEVTFSATGKTVDADGATPLLDVGEEAGVLMPSGCRMGICFGCVTPLKAGAVRDLRTGELTEAEPGVLIQTCVSAAAGPCDIER